MKYIRTKALMQTMKSLQGEPKTAVRNAIIDRTEQLFRPTYQDKACAGQCVCGHRCLNEPKALL